MFASSPATQPVPWLESTTSSRPPSHRAAAACGSIGLWCSSGVVYSASITTADAASPAARSPFSTTAGMCPSSAYASASRSAENATSCGSWS